MKEDFLERKRFNLYDPQVGGFQVAEILIYSRILKTSEIEQVEVYLNTLYGITKAISTDSKYYMCESYSPTLNPTLTTINPTSGPSINPTKGESRPKYYYGDFYVCSSFVPVFRIFNCFWCLEAVTGSKNELSNGIMVGVIVGVITGVIIQSLKWITASISFDCGERNFVVCVLW